MSPAYESLHTEMLEEIKENQDTELPEAERAAVGFWIANKYWNKLKEIVSSSVFTDDQDGIEFFKIVKPQFTGHIQYFTMISEALLFIPDKRENEITYWEEEMKRYDFFCNKHGEFVAYYKSDKYDLDATYFTKAPKDWQHISPMMTYDSDKKFCSTHDWLVRGLVAHKMYNEYAKGRWERIRCWF